MSPGKVLEYCNYYFGALFLCEMILKIFALGPGNYIKDSFNCFDAVVVTISVVDFVIEKTIDPE